MNKEQGTLTHLTQNSLKPSDFLMYLSIKLLMITPVFPFHRMRVAFLDYGVVKKGGSW